MTCSVGFRVPETSELTRDVLIRVGENTGVRRPATPLQRPSKRRRQSLVAFPRPCKAFAAEAVARALKDPQSLHSALGEMLTEPKPRVWFDLGQSPWLTVLGWFWMPKPA